MICKVHKKELIRDRVENKVGMPNAPPEGYMAALESLFPHSNWFSMGGCMMPQPKRVSVRFCPDCRLAEREWQAGREVDDFWKV